MSFKQVYEPSVMEVLMKQSGFTQATLGQAINKDQAVISNILNKVKMVDEDTRESIALVIGLADPTLLLTPYNPEMRDTYRLK